MKKSALSGCSFSSGGSPSAISNAVMPMDQTSTLSSYCVPWISSGAIQYGVPTMLERFCSSRVKAAAKPKSASLCGKSRRGQDQRCNPHDEFRRQACLLDQATLGNKDVVAFDVAMQQIAPVHVRQRFQDLWNRRQPFHRPISVDQIRVQLQKVRILPRGRHMRCAPPGIPSHPSL
eukprot:scaffold574_cov246-Pinguiococcus_pyrenoidosus.AAC.11